MEDLRLFGFATSGLPSVRNDRRLGLDNSVNLRPTKGYSFIVVSEDGINR